MTPAPDRKFVFALKVGGDTAEDLLRGLDEIVAWLQSAVDGAPLKSTAYTSGGPTAGWTAAVRVNEEQTHERYFAEVERWLAAQREQATP